MSDIFSPLFAAFMGIWLSIIGATTGDPVTVTDQAATLVLYQEDVELEEFTDEPSYVSLIDVLKDAVTKLKDTIASSTPVIAEESPENVEVPTYTTQNLGEAIVNIICIQKTDTYKRTASGSGFVISSNGVILTNAHVAQYLLLEQAKDLGETECQVRVGQEKKTAYKVELLYISPTWLLSNADFINTLSPRGNGKGDFALLHITKAVNDYILPDNFAYLPPATNSLSSDMEGDTVILVGYPSGDKVIGDRTVATTSITNLYTFGGGNADVISLAESSLGHSGSSGGPVIDHLGRAIGIISTKNTNSTALNAISLSHVDRSLKTETGYDLMNTISGDLDSRAQLYNETISPILSEILAKQAADVSALLEN